MNPACALLLTLPSVPVGLGGESPQANCFAFDLDVAGRMQFTAPNLGSNPDLQLSRVRLEVAGSHDRVTARMAMIPTRSTPESGFVGINGESIVGLLQLAGAQVDVPEAGLSITAGLVDDLWIATGNQRWALRGIAPVLGEEEGWFDRSDVGGIVAWSAPNQLVIVATSLTTGEGAFLRERNTGRNLSTMVTAHPLATSEGPGSLAISALYRDGSRGSQTARDHRFGGRLQWTQDTANVGLEVVKAVGVLGDSEYTPLGLSAWTSARPLDPLLVYGRFDYVVEGTGGTHNRVRLGAGAELSESGSNAMIGWTFHGANETGGGLAGASGNTNIHEIFVQLNARFIGAREFNDH